MRLPKFRVCLLRSILVGLLIATSASAFAAAPTITSLTPGSGTIGTSVTILGSGFAGTKAVAFDGAGATFKLMSDKTIVATAPANLATGKIVIKTMYGTAISRTNFVVTPGVDLSTQSGPPYTVLRISGAGFAPSTAVDIYFDQYDLALAISSPRGKISLQLQVPSFAQPGTHWISLVARSTDVAAQKQFRVNTNWPMLGFSAQGRSNNPFENTITNSTVSRLTDVWSKPVSPYANPLPLVEHNGDLFVGDVTGVIHAYSNTGALLWTAMPGSDLQRVTPVAFSGHVFFGAVNGNVYAYALACRKDGGLCTPKWTKSVGTTVTSSLRVFGGKLYAPSNDGSIHVLNPETGAALPPVFGFDTSHGPVTTPLTFGIDGTFYYGAGTVFEYRTTNGSSGNSTQGGAVSPIAAANGVAYFTTADGKIREFGGNNWSAPTSGTGCAPAPAVANDTVFAGGCTTLAAFEAGNGTLLWTVTTSGRVIGVSVANNVLYACIAGTLFAYDTRGPYLLWSGGGCTGAPILANGTVYSTYVSLAAYSLPGFKPGAVPARPGLGTLHPDPRLRPGQVKILPVAEAQ
jgi:hypothetical protein